MLSGIYKIINLKNNKFYIGSSSNIKYRWASHKCVLRKNKHQNRHLQFAWNKYGETAFVLKPIKFCSINTLIKWEQHFIDKYRPFIRTIGYNCAKHAQAWRGHKVSITQKLNLSKRMKGNQYATSHIPWNKGKRLSKELCEKFRQAKLRNPVRYWKNKRRSSTGFEIKIKK